MDVLGEAKRPLFFIGGGLTLANQAALFREIVDKTHIPVVSSLMGLGCIPSAQEGFLGMVGMHGSYAANMAVQECDLLIGIGVRFDDRVIGKVAAFAPEARIVHFEVDKAEINKNVVADFPVVGDLRWSLLIFARLLRILFTRYRFYGKKLKQLRFMYNRILKACISKINLPDFSCCKRIQ